MSSASAINKPPVAANKLAGTAATKLPSSQQQNQQQQQFVINPVMSVLVTVIHMAFAFFGVYLAPFGRTAIGSSFTSQLFDLLFIDKLEDYAKPIAGASFIGPALLATVTRPLGLIFDERVRSFLFSKIVPNIPQIPAEIVSSARMYVLETKMWNFIAARLIVSLAFVLSLSVLRNSLARKFRSLALPRIFSAFCLASAIPLLAASSLSTQTATMILLNFALAALFDGKLSRAFSLLTVNFAIFDSVHGLVLLVAFFAAASSIKESFRPAKAISAVLLTLPVAIFVSFTFDSVFYNKFIWPQGEVLLTFAKEIKIQSYLNSALSAVKNFSFNNLLASKLVVNLGFVLAPALIVFVFGRSNRFSRALLIFYVLNTCVSVLFFSGSINSACTPLIVPLLVASSISVLGGVKSSSNIAKSGTYLFFLGFLLPVIFWTVGRLHLEIYSAQQFTGNALMALNSKIVKESQDGVPVRVLLDSELAGFGYNRFAELSRNAIYSVDSEAEAIRTDYFIGNCPDAKALKMFQGFQKVDIKTFKIVQSDRIGVFRPSSKCPRDSPSKKHFSDLPAEIPLVISKKFFNGKFSSLKEQRQLISALLVKFNHKKISNSAALFAYLYANVLEQV